MGEKKSAFSGLQSMAHLQVSQEAFRAAMVAHAKLKNTSILSLSARPHLGPSDQPWIVAGTSSGHLVLWSFESCFDAENQVRTLRPVLSVDAGGGAVYAVHSTPFEPDPAAALLLAATDAGMVGYRWAELLAAAAEAASSGDAARAADPDAPLPTAQLTPAIDFTVPTAGPPARGISQSIAECNGIAYDRETNQVWLACGDGQAHGLDLASGAALGPLAGHSDYLHAVAVAPMARKLFTGGEDGTVRVWDLRSPPRELSCVAPAATAAGAAGGAAGVGRRDTGRATAPRARASSKGDAASGAKSWVSSLHVDDEGNWLTAVSWGCVPPPLPVCRPPPSLHPPPAPPTQTKPSLPPTPTALLAPQAGGVEGTSAGSGFASAGIGGHISKWHVGASELYPTSWTTTDAAISGLAHYEDAMLSVGDEAWVTHWSPTSVTAPKARAATSMCAAFAALSLSVKSTAATDESEGGDGMDVVGGETEGKEAGMREMLIVGGSAPAIDCFTNPSSLAFSLTL